MAAKPVAVIPSPDGSVSPDGRLARGERTRLRVAEALIELLEQGDPRPTAKAVASRAGVSLRLVFHHFEDMDAIYRAVILLQGQRHWSRLRAVPPSLPLAQRMDRTVSQRCRLFEAVSPVRRTSSNLASSSADVATWLAETNRVLREMVATTFAREVAAGGDQGPELLEALDAATSWEVWERLRNGQHLKAAAARRVVRRTLHALLAPA